MLSISPRNITDYKVTVTGTATSLYDLMDTATGDKGARDFYTKANANAVRIKPENGNIRFIMQGPQESALPTATVGEPIENLSTYILAGASLSELILISQSGTVSVTTIPYISEPAEASTMFAGSVALNDENGDPIDGTNPLPVTSTLGGVTSNNEGTIAFSATSVQLLPANASRQGLKLQYEGDGFCVIRRSTSNASLTGNRYVRLNNLDIEELMSPIWRDELQVIFSGTTGILYFDET